MNTHFAKAERAAHDELEWQMELLGNNPVIDGLLQYVGGLLAVLNEHRQILAVNRSLLETLGVENPDEVLGLRPGEAVHCIHAAEMEGGCGTSLFCSTCGAAIAIVTSLAESRSVERMCALRARKSTRDIDLYLQVRCCPITIGDTKFLLLFLQDVTNRQRYLTMEQMFFHDMNNILTALLGKSEVLSLNKNEEMQKVGNEFRQLALRLAQTSRIQQNLTTMERSNYLLMPQKLTLWQVCDELQKMFSTHNAAEGKSFTVARGYRDVEFTADFSMLLRVLGNMVVNAFEATDPGGEIRMWLEPASDGISFHVWNRRAIPADIARRVFQLNFSTKQDTGRGLGTYSMKLFGEEFLGGCVNFTSSDEDGTVFSFTLPL